MMQEIRRRVEHSSDLQARPAARTFRAFASCALTTARLLATHQLTLPRAHVGTRLQFEDGTTSSVFRETVLRDADATEPALLVVQFRLRLIRRSRLLHALFRIESIANTPLFAGFPGFRSKLWLHDDTTGVYRGIYEWHGADRADAYARNLIKILRRVSVVGTVKYHVEPNTRVQAFLRDPASAIARPASDPADAWWRLRTTATQQAHAMHGDHDYDAPDGAVDPGVRTP